MKKTIILFLSFMMHFSLFAQEDKAKTDWANLGRYAKDNELAGLPAKGVKRIVFMGNSITEFWKVFDSGFFAGKPYINRGISGQTTPQMLVRFRPDVINLKPHVVVILAGINDIAENTGPMTIEQTFGNIVSMAELARANHIKPILCSVLPALDFYWRPGLHPAEKISRLNALIKDYCEREKISYVDFYSSMADANQGLKKELSDDGVHPTLAGYRVMNPLVEAAIKKATDAQ